MRNAPPVSFSFGVETLHAMVTGLLASSQAPEINSTELPEQVKE